MLLLLVMVVDHKILGQPRVQILLSLVYLTLGFAGLDQWTWACQLEILVLDLGLSLYVFSEWPTHPPALLLLLLVGLRVHKSRKF